MLLHRLFSALLIFQSFLSPTLADWNQGWDASNITQGRVSNTTRGCLAEPKVRAFFNTQTKAGVHAPTKPTARQAPFTFRSEIFTKKITWTSPTGTKQTYGVWQRKDIDWNMVRTGGPRPFVGKTNKETAASGLAPQLKNGHFVRLHHVGQKGPGPLVEVRGDLHDPSNRKAFKALHNQFGGKAHPTQPVDHSSGKWSSDRSSYWKWRSLNGK